jgi:hypothetical protein
MAQPPTRCPKERERQAVNLIEPSLKREDKTMKAIWILMAMRVEAIK